MSTTTWDGVCDCPRANHRHGGPLTRQKHGCHCDACQTSARAYMREVKASGGLVDTSRIKARLNGLQRRGMPLFAIAAKAGVNKSTVQRIASGVAPRAQGATVEALSQVRFAPDPRRPWRDARPYTLRVRALVSIGWSMSQVAREAGLSEKAVQSLAHGVHRSTRREVAESIADTYRRLVMDPQSGTSAATQARMLAKANGWRHPFDLDEDELRD